MEGVYVLQPNGDITSLLSGYSKNFEKEAFKEFGDKTQKFGQLFDAEFVEVCRRKVFSFDVAEGTRLSFVFSKDTPPLDGSPDPMTLFRVAFKTFTLRLIPKINSETHLVDDSSLILLEGGETFPSIDILRSSELLLQLAFDYEKFVASQSNKDFPIEEWQRMLGVFKDDIRVAAVRSSNFLASQLNIVQNKLVDMHQDYETSRLIQDERDKRIDVLSKTVQTLSVHLEKSEHIQTSSSTQQILSDTASGPNTAIINSPLKVNASKSLTTTCGIQSICKDSGEEKESTGDMGDVATDSNPVDDVEGNVTVVTNLEKLLLASKQAIFYLQRDLQAVKLERDSYYHQILELRRARQIYEKKRHQNLKNIPPGEPPDDLQKKNKLKEDDASAAVNGKTNTFQGQAGPGKGTN